MHLIEELKEKKVEYIELIYDLIFVYIIGRNNRILFHFENGFVEPLAFLIYIVATLAVIQIWSFTMYYINIYGRKSVREHVFLFINMFLLYFIGEATRADWQIYHTQYHIAWALILVNTGVQYLIELRNHETSSRNRQHILRMAGILFAEAVVASAAIFEFQARQSSVLSVIAILMGMCTVVLFGQKNSEDAVDFPHLSERAMLYVVFTFGEMIIAIATYFEGEFSIRDTYFALMAFLIVVALFLSYGVFYDHIIDREKKTNGLEYMFLHIFIIFAMNNITNGLKFMQEVSIALVPKIIFMIVSFVLYFGFLFALGHGHAKDACRRYRMLWLNTTVLGAVFAVAMYLLRENMVANIAVTVLFTFVVFGGIWHYGLMTTRAEEAKQDTLL